MEINSTVESNNQPKRLGTKRALVGLMVSAGLGLVGACDAAEQPTKEPKSLSKVTEYDANKGTFTLRVEVPSTLGQECADDDQRVTIVNMNGGKSFTVDSIAMQGQDANTEQSDVYETTEDSTGYGFEVYNQRHGATYEVVGHADSTAALKTQVDIECRGTSE